MITYFLALQMMADSRLLSWINFLIITDDIVVNMSLIFATISLRFLGVFKLLFLEIAVVAALIQRFLIFTGNNFVFISWKLELSLTPFLIYDWCQFWRFFYDQKLENLNNKNKVEEQKSNFSSLKELGLWHLSYKVSAILNLLQSTAEPWVVSFSLLLTLSDGKDSLVGTDT